jgi:hypothetical protein
MTNSITQIAEIAVAAATAREASWETTGIGILGGRYRVDLNDAIDAHAKHVDLSQAEKSLIWFLAATGEGSEICQKLLTEQSETV